MKRLLVLLVGITAPLGASCLIAESPAQVPEQVPERPTILESLVEPSARVVLASFPPSGFLVPVKLFNPQQAVEWRVFVDFDPQSQNIDNKPVAQGVSRPAAQGASRPGQEDITDDDPLQGIRRIQFFIDTPDPTTCHTIEFVVATEFPGSDTRNQHAVDALQSSRVVWFYSPGGNLGGCPVQDAGITGGSGAN